MFVPRIVRRVRFRAVLELPCPHCRHATEHGLRQLVTTPTFGRHRLPGLLSEDALECRACGRLRPITRSYAAQLARRAHAAAAPDWISVASSGGPPHPLHGWN